MKKEKIVITLIETQSHSNNVNNNKWNGIKIRDTIVIIII